MRKLLEDFLNHYLCERNLSNTLALITDNVLGIGAGKQSIAKGKQQLRSLMETEFAQLPNPMTYEIVDCIELSQSDNICNLFATLQIRLNENIRTTDLKTRLSSTCVKTNGVWKITCLHISTPSLEGDQSTFLPLHFGSKSQGLLPSSSDIELLYLLSKSIPGGIIGAYLDKDYPLYAINDKMLNILGYSYEGFLAATKEKVINTIHPDDRERVQQIITEQFDQSGEYEIEYRAIGKGNRIIWVHDIGKKITTMDGHKAMISIITDISERKWMEDQLRKAAEYDYMTGLHNRNMSRTIIEMDLKNYDGGILFICDVDNFKSVNDTKGHIVGDSCLRHLSAIIKKYAKPPIRTGRLGGDEFILFFPGFIPKEQAVSTVQTIQKEFFDYMQNLAPELNVSLSTGRAIRENQESLNSLYEKADKALYRTKKLRS